MPDEISSATSADSSSAPSTVGATGAGGSDAAVSTGTTDQGAQSAQPAGEDLFSAGWSFDDQAQETPGIEDLTDEQIGQYLQDQQLDQARAPKLVEDLRGARAQLKTLKSENAQLRQQLGQFDQFGGIEAAAPGLELVNNLIADPGQGTLPFLQAIAENATPAYWQIADALLEYEPAYLVQQLQERGLLPEQAASAPTGYIDDETIASLPQNLQNIARNLSREDVAEFQELVSPEAQAGFLKRIEQLNQLTAGQRQQAEAAWRYQVDQAKQQGEASITTLSDQYEQAHFAQLNKWQPFGPDNSAQNQSIYKMVVEGAFADLLADQKWSQMYHDTLSMLRNAPLRRLHNEGMAAGQDEQRARGMAAQFNTRLGQLMKDRIQMLDSVFRDARAYRETQRQAAPQRREIAGMSATNNGAGGPPPVTKDGKTNPEWWAQVMSQLPKG